MAEERFRRETVAGIVRANAEGILRGIREGGGEGFDGGFSGEDCVLEE